MQLGYLAFGSEPGVLRTYVIHSGVFRLRTTYSGTDDVRKLRSGLGYSCTNIGASLALIGASLALIGASLMLIATSLALIVTSLSLIAAKFAETFTEEL